MAGSFCPREYYAATESFGIPGAVQQTGGEFAGKSVARTFGDCVIVGEINSMERGYLTQGADRPRRSGRSGKA